MPFPANLRRSLLRVASLALASGLLAGAAFAAEPGSGGALNWIVSPEPASIVPLTTTAGGNCEIGPKIVEGLLTYDYKLNPKPLLATAWSVSKDGPQYRFVLRRGVKWHDGKEFTSADVAFSILTLKQYHPRGRSAFANVASVRTPDAHTAVLLLAKPSPFLLTALASTDSSIVSNIEVRRALALAIDVNAFNKLVWFGYGQVAAAPIGPLLAKYHDAGIATHPFNLKQAEAGLDAAGYKRGAGGRRFKLRLLWNPFQEKRASEFVRQSLAKIGANPRIAVLAKKVKNYAPTAEGLRGSFSALSLQE